MKVYIKTLGCDKNTCDSEFIKGGLLDKGYKITDDPYKADVMLVNTCGFINDAKVQSIESIFELASIKTDKQRLIVTGCLSQRYGKELFKEMPEVDAFLGVNDYDKLEELLNSDERLLYNNKASKTYKEYGSRAPLKGLWSAPIKISDGCKNVCAYCAIPYIRGGYRSRDSKLIIDEAEELAKQGVKELILVGQDVTAYEDLPGLLRKLCRIDGIHWIRIMYCYEDEITDELIDVIKSEKKIVKYLDIPLQHYSDKILKSMNRKSRSETINKTIARLRNAIPDIRIRTTFIVGFPGEHKDDFKALYDFVNETRFDRLGVFTYSKEEGTRAAKMSGQVSEDAKLRRQEKIMELQRRISLEHNQEMVGSIQEVLVEELDSEGVYIGRTQYDAPDIDNEVIFTSKKKLKLGSFVNVKITDAFDYDLNGELV